MSTSSTSLSTPRRPSTRLSRRIATLSPWATVKSRRVPTSLASTSAVPTRRRSAVCYRVVSVTACIWLWHSRRRATCSCWMSLPTISMSTPFVRWRRVWRTSQAVLLSSRTTVGSWTVSQPISSHLRATHA